MNSYMMRLIDEYGIHVSEASWVGYGPLHALDDAILNRALFVPGGFVGNAEVVNERGIAYLFEIGFMG